MAGVGPHLDAIDRGTLTPVVQRILPTAAAEVITWGQRPLEHRAVQQNTGGLYLFSGQARVGGVEQSWRVVLKVVRNSADSAALVAADREPGAPSYWKREPELFRDGVLDDVGGNFIPPRCYGVVEPDEETAWIWLEDVVEADGPDWPLARYGLAARHLGQFNGRYLVGKPIPSHQSFCPSLPRTEMMLARTRGRVLPPPAVWDELAIRSGVSSADAERFARLWAEQERFLDVLDRLPQTFCHRDAFRKNLIARRTTDGREQTVAIDWALAGPGHLGEDLYKLVAISQAFLRTECGPRELDAVVFEHYLAGLRDVGWTEDPRLVRLGYTATAVMHAAAGFLILALRHPDFAAKAAWIAGKPVEELRSRWIEVSYYVLDLADEARGLMTQLDLAHPAT